MRFKRFLIGLLFLSAFVYGFYLIRVNERISSVYGLFNGVRFWEAALFCFALLLVGHLVRAYKFKLLLQPVKDSGTRTQLQSLLIGYLFNTLLPLRLGEVIRAFVLGRSIKMSTSLMFALVVLERAFDGIILSLLGFILVLVPGFLPDGIRDAVVALSALLLFIGCTLLTFLALLYHQNSRVLSGWHRATGLLNLSLQTKARFKLWSVIYGLQKLLNRRALARYAVWSVAMWACYLGAMTVLASFLFNSPLATNFIRGFLSFLGLSVPSGPASLGSYQAITDPLYQTLATGQASLDWLVVSWLMLAIPTSVLGAVLLLRHHTSYGKLMASASKGNLRDKLAREQDISQEMKYFLDKYFSGNSLSRIVHQLELSEDFRLVKYFKGGSDAITILAIQDDKEVVKKIIPLEFKGRLKAQYDWLKQRNGTPGIVRVLAEEDTGNYYAIDLEYDSENEMFFEFIHQNPIGRSKKVMDAVWESLFAKVYHETAEIRTYPKERHDYIDTHIFKCLEKAAAVDPELIKAAVPEKLIINGRSYDNLHQIMSKIKQHPQAWKDIATFRRSHNVHGDVTVDNLLVSRKNGEVLMIDPAPDGNIINGPVFDFGKNMQSLYCGYETLLRDEDQVVLTDGNCINYRDLSSDKYRLLSDYVTQELAPRYLAESEVKAMLFHAGALYIRRLKHQVYYTPANVLKLYAVGVKTLNDFLAQYE